MSYGFVPVSAGMYGAFLGWYADNIGKYHIHPITLADRTNVYADAECEELIAFREYAMYEVPEQCYINREYFKI